MISSFDRLLQTESQTRPVPTFGMSLSGMEEGGGRRWPHSWRSCSKRWMPDGCVENRTLVREWPCAVAQGLAQQRTASHSGARPCVVVYGPRTTAHRPCVVVYGPRTTAHRPCVAVYGPRTTAHRPCVVVRSPCTTAHRPSVVVRSPCTTTHRPCVVVRSPCTTAHRPCVVVRSPRTTANGLASLCEALARRRTALRHCAQPPPLVARRQESPRQKCCLDAIPVAEPWATNAAGRAG